MLDTLAKGGTGTISFEIAGTIEPTETKICLTDHELNDIRFRIDKLVYAVSDKAEIFLWRKVGEDYKLITPLAGRGMLDYTCINGRSAPLDADPHIYMTVQSQKKIVYIALCIDGTKR